MWDFLTTPTLFCKAQELCSGSVSRHYDHILLSFAYRQSPQIPVVTPTRSPQFAVILENTHAHADANKHRCSPTRYNVETVICFLTSKLILFSVLLSHKNESDHMHIQQKKKNTTTNKRAHTHLLTCALDKVNGNYQEDLARNLQTDTDAPCSFKRCVCLHVHVCVCVWWTCGSFEM